MLIENHLMVTLTIKWWQWPAIKVMSVDLEDIDQGHHLHKSLNLIYCMTDFNQTFTKIMAVRGHFSWSWKCMWTSHFTKVILFQQLNKMTDFHQNFTKMMGLWPETQMLHQLTFKMKVKVIACRNHRISRIMLLILNTIAPKCLQCGQQSNSI